MQSTDFLQFMHHFIKYSNSSTDRPTLLLLDNHSSHLSVDVLDLAVANGVTMLSFPPHCSHRLQPLDVSVFKPLKGAYTARHNRFIRNQGQALQLLHIPMLVRQAIGEAVRPQIIERGFEVTGICPFDPSIFTDADFVSLGVDQENEDAAAVERKYGEEEQRRIVVDPSELDVAAHETVSTSDPSESAPSTSGMSRATNSASVLDEIGPLRTKAVIPKKSTRGPKPQKTSILTSPEFISAT